MTEKIDLSSIHLVNPMGYEAAKEALDYIKSEFSKAIHVEGRIIVRLNSPR